MIQATFLCRLVLFAAATSLCLFCPLRKGRAQSPDASASQAASPPESIRGSISAWPAAGSIAAGTNVLIETTRSYGVPYRCTVENVDDRAIACRGPRHRPVVYERDLVRTLSVQTQHLRHAFIGFVITGALLTGGGLLCVAAGAGSGCAVVLAVGLVADLVAGILHNIAEVRQPGEPTPIYIASPTTTANATPA